MLAKYNLYLYLLYLRILYSKDEILGMEYHTWRGYRKLGDTKLTVIKSIEIKTRSKYARNDNPNAIERFSLIFND
jgi:hypothetical protein